MGRGSVALRDLDCGRASTQLSGGFDR